MSTKRLVMSVVIAALAAVGTASSSSADSAPISQFAVENGSISPATGTPMPASGTHAALWSNASAATSTIRGEGRVVVGAMGQACKGMPTIRVSVDGVVLRTVRLKSSTVYRRYVLGRALQQGSHDVRIVMTNDRFDSSACDRNSFISYATMERQEQATPPPPPPPPTRPPPSGQPGPDNTGVPSGLSLQPHYGNMTITQDGTVIDRLDIHGFVDVRADNVVIKNSIVRGGDPGTVNMSLISAYGDHRNLVIQDTTLVGAYPSPYLDGLKGLNFTATRLDISNVVDTVLIFGDNATVQNSWLHGNTHFEVDPRTQDGFSHDDSIQIEGGRNVVVRNNTLEGAHNAAIMVTQNVARTREVTVTGNWVSGGWCSINLSEKGKGPIEAFAVQNNRFGASRNTHCGIIAPPTSPVTMSNNVYTDTGELVTVTRGA